jgi:hypothetical protein
MDVQAKRGIDAFAAEYRTAGGGKKGLAAVNEKFGDIFGGAGTLSKEDIEQQAARANATKQSGAQAFNNQLERIGEDLANKLTPSLNATAPAALKAAEAMTSFATWAASEPKKAIMTAIGAAYAKEALTSFLKNEMSGGTKLGKAVGTLGTVAGVAAAAYATFEIGQAAINILSEKAGKGQTTSQNRDFEVGNVLSAAFAARERGEDPTKVLEELEATRAKQKARIDAAENSTSFLGALWGEMFGGKGFEARSAEKADEDRISTLKEDLDRVEKAIHQLREARLRVHVDNMPSSPLTSPSDGRVGIDGHGGD